MNVCLLGEIGQADEKDNPKRKNRQTSLAV
ncbi:MAG: hypothetical protein ACJAZC_002093 [Cryomorphaceae bacterium]|jgi:hypothetical protein